MDFISTALVTLKQPTGFWESILNAFKNGTGTYIVAVILVALIVRVLFALVDIVNKKVNMKNADINNKMKPELEAIQKKYGYDQRLMQQKTNEIYKKYQFSMMSSCLPMLVAMILQFTVFLTLWNSLQAVSNYNIAEKYENMKNVYANVIVLNEDTALKNELTSLAGQEYSLSADIDVETNQLVVTVTKQNDGNAEFRYDYKTNWTNEEIFELLNNYVIAKEEPAPTPDPDEGETTALEYNTDTGFNDIFKNLAEESAKQYFQETQESFLWIKNIYRPESPTSPLFTKKEITTYLSKYYSAEEKETEKANDYEGKIFDCVIGENASLKEIKQEKNGYYILTIIAVLTSFLSIWLSNKLMKNKNTAATPGQNPGGSKFMYFMMPLIIGLFTFMYTSLFAIYLIVGQVVNIALTPFTTWVVRKWLAADNKKKQEKEEIVVDYRRKDK